MYQSFDNNAPENSFDFDLSDINADYQAMLDRLGIRGSDLDDVSGDTIINAQHQHGVIEPNELAYEQFPAHHVPGTPPHSYISLQPPVGFPNPIQSVANAHSSPEGSYGYLPPSPQPPVQAAAPRLPQSKPHGLTFRNLTEAKDSMLDRQIDDAWSAPKPDSTIPTNDEQRAAYVSNLLEAMKDMSACSDKRDRACFKNRWLPSGIHAFHPEQMEKVCWQLVEIAENLHVIGPASLCIYDKPALETVRKSRRLTFEQRMDNLVALLRLSKARCFSLLKGENLDTTVGAPAQRCSGTVLNNGQNEKRQAYIKEGRTVVKEKKSGTPPEDFPVTVDSEEESSPVAERIQMPAVSMPAGLMPNDSRTITFGDLQSRNIQSVSQYAGDNFGQYGYNQHVGGNPYYDIRQPGQHHALLSQESPMLMMQPPPAPPSTPTFMPHMVGFSSENSYLLPANLQRPSKAPKRSAQDAQLGTGSDVSAQRPRLEDNGTLWN